MFLKEKLSVNVGNATLYVEIYHKTDPATNVVVKDGWKIGDTTWNRSSPDDFDFVEMVYTGTPEDNPWQSAPLSFITNVCSIFFNDIAEASEYVVRILNNDPSFNEEEYLAKEKENVKAIN